MEENNDIYQSVESSEQEVQETSETVEYGDETVVDTTPQEEFDIIKYNKEEIKIPVSERQTYLQKGYNYDKVQSQLEQTKRQAEYVERIARIQGYENPQDFISAFEEMENQRRIEQEAEKIGVDTEVFKEYLEPMRQELDTLKKERERFEQMEGERQIEQQIIELKSKYPDFDKYQDQIFDIAIRKGYELEDAYILASYEEKAKQIEQQTLAKVAGRNQKQVLSSIDKPGEQLFDINHLTSEQIKEISARVQRGERITF